MKILAASFVAWVVVCLALYGFIQSLLYVCAAGMPMEFCIWIFGVVIGLGVGYVYNHYMV